MMKQSEVASLLPSTLVFVQYLTPSTSFFFIATSSKGGLGVDVVVGVTGVDIDGVVGFPGV
jgi:hypothetical protein